MFCKVYKRKKNRSRRLLMSVQKPVVEMVGPPPYFSADLSIFFLYFFFVLYSTLLHLPPLRFHCADECWDRTQDRCNWCIGSQYFLSRRRNRFFSLYFLHALQALNIHSALHGETNNIWILIKDAALRSSYKTIHEGNTDKERKIRGEKRLRRL